MKKTLAILCIIFFQTIALAKSCPLTSYENRLEYRYSSRSWLICDYQNVKLISRFQHSDFETISIEYFENGMPREYNVRSQNYGGGLYLENRRYNSSGMLISHSMSSGNSGFDCYHAGGYQLNCISLQNGVQYSESVEYASQYEEN